MPIPHLRKLLVAAAACAAIAFAAQVPASHAARHSEGPGTRCGGTLWRLMTLSDAGAKQVNLHGKDTTIADIAGLHTPARIVPRRTSPFQRQVWRMRAVIDRYRIASNGEIVLVLFSIDTGQFMDAYLPAKNCLGQKARDRTGVLSARNELTSRCPKVTAAWQLLGITVEIGGVGFWNPVRTTRGALLNGAELRPVTNLKVLTGCGVGQ